MPGKKETSDAKVDAAGKAASDQAQDSTSAKKKYSKGKSEATGPRHEHVPSKPGQFTDMTRDRAEKLATMRRGWFDEFTWAALGGFFASLPATVHSYTEMFVKHVRNTPWSISEPEAVDFGVTLIFATLILVAFLYGKNRGLSSMQYLETMYGIDPDAKEPRIIRLRKWCAARKEEWTRKL